MLERYKEIVALDPAFGEAHLFFAEIVGSMLAPTSPVPAGLYQAHRILLMAGRVAAAADVGERDVAPMIFDCKR